MEFENLIQEYKDISSDDEYEAIIKAKNFLKEGKYDQCLELLEVVQVDMEKNHEMIVERNLFRLMQHVFLCIDFPEKMRDNDAAWLKKIDECRDEIAYIMAIQPTIDRAYLESVWEEEQEAGLKFARIYEKVSTEKLDWEQVFEIRYGALNRENCG